jgi:transposase-like protein
MKQTIQQFFKQFPDDETCLTHIMQVRYGLEGTCPKCERETKFSRVKSQRAYACQWCGWHTYPCVGTPFEASRTSLQLWFYAIYLFTKTRSGVSAKELQRQLGVTYKCAWRMGHEIRKHMQFVDGDPMLSGDVEVDETYMGGKGTGIKSRNRKHRTILMGMLEKDGDVITKVVPNVQRVTLHGQIESNIEKGSTVHTDEWVSYKKIDEKGYKHKTVNHGAKEYARADTHVNGIEGFWSRLKQSIGGTHIHVSGKHLAKYAGEFEYRFNSRHQPEAMLPELLGTFEPLKK